MSIVTPRVDVRSPINFVNCQTLDGFAVTLKDKQAHVFR